jgi:site-specific DNA-methyltransferase (adenine-specific)/adenine-specific DNA-methyltransferase
MLQENRIWWGKDGKGIPAVKRFLSEVKEGVTPTSLWLHQDAGHNAEAKNEIRELLGELPAETLTPKPTRLIQRILQIATDTDSLVLDSFAGSGTTAHAVLKQNADDNGNRRFILVEIDRTIAQTVTAERARRIIVGYTNTKGTAIQGIGGGFQFCRLSDEPLFDAEGQIRSAVSFAQLAEFVWFTETGSGLAQMESGKFDSPLLGMHEGRAIYLLYNGILRDRSIAGGNVLTGPVFDQLPKFDGPKVIFAAANRMGDRAARENITFKQTPYALDV